MTQIVHIPSKARNCAAVRVWPVAVALLVACALAPKTLRAQNAPVALDTTKLGADARSVFRLWNAYLVSRAGKRAQRADVPSPYWLLSEQKRWPFYDMAASYLDDDAEPEIVSVARAKAHTDSVYRIVTRFYPKGRKPTEDLWRNAMTVTVYAVRDGRDWKLSSALPRETAGWKRDTVGPITYVYATTYTYNRARAKHAVAFIDSLSKVFGVPRPDPVAYFLSATSEEAYGLMGLESDVKYGATGAVAQPVNHQIFSGDPKWGEEYLHELVHIVVAPLSASGNTMYFFNEGIATWLGGTVGLTYQQSLRGLAEYLREHPAVTLDSLIDQGGPQTQLYRGGALLTEMVFERGGTSAVKSLFDAGPSANDFRSAVSRIMQQPWSKVVDDWRKRALNSVKPVS